MLRRAKSKWGVELHAPPDRSSRCSPRPVSVAVGRTTGALHRNGMRPTVARLTIVVALLMLTVPLAAEAQQAGIDLSGGADSDDFACRADGDQSHPSSHQGGLG